MVEYKSYRYTMQMECHKKIDHRVTDPDGKEIYCGFSPYCVMTKELFARWIDAGCPKRERLGNWDASDFM